MSELENGWYLRSEGYMTSEYSYQRIESMKGNRALDNHGCLVFVEFMGGCERDSRVYVPHPGECELVYGENDYGDDGWWCQSCGGWFAASFRHTGRNNIIEPNYCQCCGGKAVKR